MNIFRKLYCRSFQMVLRAALPILPYRNPKVLNSFEDVPEILRRKKRKNPLIITDSTLSALGATNHLQETMKQAEVNYAFFDGAYPNPTTELVEEAAELEEIYREVMG